MRKSPQSDMTKPRVRNSPYTELYGNQNSVKLKHEILEIP